MNIIKLKLDKQHILQISVTVLISCITIILPIISYIQFKITLNKNSSLGIFELKLDTVFISIIIIGIILSALRYYNFQLPQFSVKRGILTLMNSILFVIFLSVIAQIGIINIDLENSSFYLNLTGVFIVLILVWALFIFKNIYDVIDFKLNQAYYSTSLRRKQFLYKNSQKLIKCPKCKYMCRIGWKKCPICNTKI